MESTSTYFKYRNLPCRLTIITACALFSSFLGVVVSQCVDIPLAYLSGASPRKGFCHPADSLDSKSSSLFSFFVVIVRWLKGRVYVVQPTKPPVPSPSHRSNGQSKGASPPLDPRLDPQPGYSCHMAKWSRLDSLDPSKISLEEVFHSSQVCYSSPMLPFLDFSM